MLQQAEAHALIEGRNGDRVEGGPGPAEFGNQMIWEVWVKDKNAEPGARFVVCSPDAKPVIYDSVQELIVRLNFLYYDQLSGIAGRERVDNAKIHIEKGKF